jgi:hypothetical protein
MIDKSAAILTTAIMEMRANQQNDVEIAIDLIGSAVPCMLEAAGTKHTADFLRNLATQIEQADQFVPSVN